MKSTIARENYSSSSAAQTAGKEYQWKQNGTDGLRSYSYDESNPSWSYAEIAGTEDKGYGSYYTFTDSSTGKPSARRGNLYNLATATLGSSLGKSGQATDSICPRGWQLPVKAKNDNESIPIHEITDKSWSKVLRVYDVANNTTGFNRFVSRPLEYLPTGYYSDDGYIASRTTNGEWWLGEPSGNWGYVLSPSSSSVSIRDFTTPGGYGHAQRC